MAATYPATTFQEAVELTIEAANQQAQVVRGDANTEVMVADGSTIPSIRKAQADSMYFKEPELWTTGQTETDYLQLKKYIDPITNKESWWFAKGALVSNPIAMGISPFGDDNWTLYTPEDLFISGKAEYESIYQALKGKAAEAGYNLVRGSFEEGANISGWPDVVWCQDDGKYYKWHLDEAKTVLAGSVPTNIGTDWIDKSGKSLRDEIRETVFQNMKRQAAGAGFNLVDGSFEEGGTLTNTNDVLWCQANGKYYNWFDGSAKTVAPGTDPAASGSGYTPRTDAGLRAEITPSVTESLRRSYAEAGYTLVSGSFEAGGTLTTATDVLLYEANGFAYNWGGVLPKVVPAASSPATTGGVGPNGWLDVSDASLREYLAATGGSSLVSAAKSIVSPGNIAKFGDTTGIATLIVPDETQQRFLLSKKVTNPNDFATMQLLRRVNHGGGVAGYVGFGLNAKTEVRGSSLQSEWTGFFGLDNYSTASGTWPQHVAVYGQANKRSPTNTWAGCLEINDESGSGAAIGLEITARCNGADHPSFPQRNGSHISIMRGESNQQDGEWGRGYWITTGDRSQFRYGFAADGSCSNAVFKASVSATAANTSLIRDTSTIPLGIDLSAASYSSNIALALKAGHAVSWEATQQIRTNFDQSTGRWQILKGSTPAFWVDVNTGQTSVGGGAKAPMYLSAKLSSPQTIATGTDKVVQYNSVGRNTTEGLITLDNGVFSVSPSVAEFEVVACVQCISSNSAITLRMSLGAFTDGVYYPNPRHMYSGLNPSAHISTGIIYNPPTGSTRLLYTVLDVGINPVQVEASGASAIMVRVLSTR